MRHDPHEPLLDPEEDARVDAALGAITAALTVPPDEVTARRPRRAIARARATQPVVLARRSVATGVAAAVLVGALAVGGVLPDPAQRAAADLAARIGILLPRPTTDEVPPIDLDEDGDAADRTDTTDADAARTARPEGTDDPARSSRAGDAEVPGTSGADRRQAPADTPHTPAPAAPGPEHPAAPPDHARDEHRDEQGDGHADDRRDEHAPDGTPAPAPPAPVPPAPAPPAPPSPPPGGSDDAADPGEEQAEDHRDPRASDRSSGAGDAP
jgi:hypothetical protein